MNELVNKVRRVEQDIADEKGPLYLCALVEPRDYLHNRWDLLISAPWAKRDRDTILYVADVLNRHLTDERWRVSSIQILDPSEHPVNEIHERYDVEHGKVEVLDAVYMDLDVRRAYIITSRRAA